MSKPRNYMLRAWGLLLLVGIITLGLYYLPEHIGDWELKPVDLLSDLRSDSTEQVSDTLVAGFPIHPQTDRERKTMEAHREIYEQVQAKLKGQSSDSLVTIEDYTPSHTALQHFFAQVQQRASLSRPVRIAMLGDSFIEGDICAAPLRQKLQQQWGGSGVGWMPMQSETAGFRQSIRQQAKGWQIHSMLEKGQHGFPLSQYYFTARSGASTQYSVAHNSPTLGYATLYYRSSTPVPLSISHSETDETIELAASEHIGRYDLSNSPVSSINLTIGNPSGDLIVYGVALEGHSGISLDNYSLRGSSGTHLSGIDPELSEQWATLRPYDLIILEYGLNVASSKQKDYSYYTKQMTKVIAKLKSLYPESSILLMGVSDRGQKTTGGVVTMPGALYLQQAQRALAREQQIAFWSTMEAMKAIGGIEALAQKGWAAKDYTHLTHSGGAAVADKLLQAIELEYQYYNALHQ